YGGVSTATTTVTIKNVAPTAKMGAIQQPDKFFILPGQNLVFNASFTDPGWLDTHTAVWNFGDGTTAKGTLTEEHISPDSTGTATVSHVYSKPGTYTVTLTVTDKDGASKTVSMQLKVLTVQSANNEANNYIQKLSNTAFNGNARSLKLVYATYFAVDNQLLNFKSYQAALTILNQIKTTTSGKNAWIKDTTAQKDINKMLDDIIAYIKTM
ncbi:MAG: PKD domain-containing protein, partial [Methanobacterium sp.]